MTITRERGKGVHETGRLKAAFCERRPGSFYQNAAGCIPVEHQPDQTRQQKGTAMSSRQSSIPPGSQAIPPQQMPPDVSRWGEHPSTYVVQDRTNGAELARLALQDTMITAAMGGVLPDQTDPASLRRLLDVGCGTGGWLIEIAKAYPTIKLLVGVDISKRMVEYARTQAEAQEVSDRVEFHMMDALRMLEFPPRFFDLVNQRLGNSYLRSWDWPKLLQEYQRVTRPGGIMRITESEMSVESSSPTLTRLFEVALAALAQAGHFFTPQSRGVTGDLARLLHQHGLQQVQTKSYALEYRAGTPEGDLFVEDMQHLFRTLLPFLHKWTRVPDDYEALYQQMLQEIHQPDFVAKGNMLTAWGRVLGSIDQPESDRPS
jgi:ubiquinone/menaquinone biosynthesis C-methylase UbiE